MNSEKMEIKPIDILSVDDRLVAGWASVEIVDRQGQVVPIDELNSALLRYSMRGAPLNYGHKNHQVGRVINWYIIKHPKTGKWGVYIIGYIFKGEPIYDIVWDAIKEGKLSGFSIAGIAGETEREMIKDADGVLKPAEILRKVTITEISVVEKPANPLAIIEQVNKFAKAFDDRTVSILRSSYVKGLLDDAYDIVKDEYGDRVADGVISVIEGVVTNILRNLVVVDEFSKSVEDNNGKVVAMFSNEFEAFKYASEQSGYVVPSTNGMYAVVVPDVAMNVTGGDEVNGVVLDLDGIGQIDGVEDIMLVKEEGVLSTNSGEAYANPVYGDKVVDEKKNSSPDDKEKDGIEVSKAVKSKSELLRILIGIYNEAKKIKGFVDKHSESGAYKGMADDIVKTLEALIDEVRNDIIVVEGEEISKTIKSKAELLRILIGIYNEAKKVKGFVDKHSKSGAYKGMAEDIVKTLEALIDEVEHGIIDVRKSDGESAVLKRIKTVLESFRKDGLLDVVLLNKLRQALIEELEVIKYYEMMAEQFREAGYDVIAEKLLSVVDDEKRHIGEFLAIIEDLSPEDTELITEGYNEQQDNSISVEEEDVVEVVIPVSDDDDKDVVIEKANEKKKRGEHKKCMEKYYNFEENHFKGRAGTGERFENCVKAQMHCNGKSKEEARAICAKIAREKGIIPHKKALDEVKRSLDVMLKEVKKAKEKKKSACMKKYKNREGRFREMTCPDDPSERSRFCGCVRAQMTCNGKSLKDAKEICGYIRWYVKKSAEVQMSILKAKLDLLAKELRKAKDDKKKKRNSGNRKKQDGPGRPKDKCRRKYVDTRGMYKKMSDPKHPKKPISEFWGCVRYAMECRRMSYNDAKNWCGKARYEALSGVGERTSIVTKK